MVRRCRGICVVAIIKAEHLDACQRVGAIKANDGGYAFKRGDRVRRIIAPETGDVIAAAALQIVVAAHPTTIADVIAPFVSMGETLHLNIGKIAIWITIATLVIVAIRHVNDKVELAKAKAEAAGLKAATITPEERDDVGSPNRIIREEIGGKVIVRTGRRIPGVIPFGGVHAPISVVRMAVGDAYGAKEWREGEGDEDAEAGTEVMPEDLDEE